MSTLLEQNADHRTTILQGIAWPTPLGYGERPVWTGRGFRLAGHQVPVLKTAMGADGWNEDLAQMMAAENSPARPIGRASRRAALRALRHHGGAGYGKVVMEVGCANGYMLEAIRENFPDTAAIGCDAEILPLEALALRIPDVPLIQLDLTRSVLPDKFCDTIVMLNVLEHIEDDSAALEQVGRMLRPHGLLILEVPADPACYTEFDRLVGHFRRYRARDLVTKMRACGFTIVEMFQLGSLAYPAFRLHKYREARLAGRADDKEIVLRTMRAGRPSLVQDLVFRLEDLIRPFAPLPFGIRCFAVARTG